MTILIYCLTGGKSSGDHKVCVRLNQREYIVLVGSPSSNWTNRNGQEGQQYWFDNFGVLPDEYE